MPRSTDTNIGPYHLDTLIGSGETGDVYKATDTGLNRTVAIKVFKDKDADRGRHGSAYIRRAPLTVAPRSMTSK